MIHRIFPNTSPHGKTEGFLQWSANPGHCIKFFFRNGPRQSVIEMMPGTFPIRIQTGLRYVEYRAHQFD